MTDDDAVTLVGGWARTARRAAGSGVRLVRRATHAQGAGDSGLAKLIEIHAINTAGDAFVAIALAGTLFFGVPTGQARGQVALYLLVTMAPFAIVAPVIGPALDRLRQGRRWAMAATFAIRATLAWALAGAVIHRDAVQLYPAAFGVLVLSKAYGVTRSSAVPRLLPPSIGLVKANGRISLFGLVGSIVAAGIGGAVTAFAGPEWSLRLSVVVFVVGAVLAVRLPARVDHAEGEEEDLAGRRVPTGAAEASPAGGGRLRRPRLRPVGPVVALGLRANAAIRAFSGFLVFFLAFLLRTHPVDGLDPAVATGIVVAAAGIGSGGGLSLGAWVRDRAPEAFILAALAACAFTSVLGAWMYGIVTIALVAMFAGLAQSLGKLSLDALIQQETPDAVRSSVFARSETLLQLSWVLGGGVGTVLPLSGALGLGLAAAGLVVVLGWVARSWQLQREHRAHGRPHPGWEQR